MIIGIIPLVEHLPVMVVSILALEGVVGCTCVCSLHPMLKYLEVRCPKWYSLARGWSQA